MARTVKLSGQSAAERSKLPGNVRNGLDDYMNRLAQDPNHPGRTQRADFLGISQDGSRFDILLFYTFDDSAQVMVVETIDVISY